MSEKKIIINISEDGSIDADTVGMHGVECVETLDKLMKEIANEVSITKKPEYFSEGTKIDNTIKNKTNG